MKWIPLLFRRRPRLRVSSMSTGQWQTDRKVLRNTKLEKKRNEVSEITITETFSAIKIINIH